MTLSYDGKQRHLTPLKMDWNAANSLCTFWEFKAQEKFWFEDQGAQKKDQYQKISTYPTPRESRPETPTLREDNTCLTSSRPFQTPNTQWSYEAANNIKQGDEERVEKTGHLLYQYLFQMQLP